MPKTGGGRGRAPDPPGRRKLLLDRYGRPLETPKERPLIGFRGGTLPHRDDFDVLLAVEPRPCDPVRDNDAESGREWREAH